MRPACIVEFAISYMLLPLILHLHPFLIFWANHCNQHHICSFKHFKTLLYFLTCFTLIMTSPYASVNCQWILMGETCFTHKNKITLWTLSDQVSTAIVFAIGCQHILRIASAWVLHCLLHVIPAKNNNFLPKNKVLQ